MSSQHQNPVNSSIAATEHLNKATNGVSQRAHNIVEQHRENRAANGENTETVVSMTIPLSMQAKFRNLNNYLALSTDNILHSAINYVINYAKDKEIKIQSLKGYPKEINSDDDCTTLKLELSQKIFDELENQNLLCDVSKIAILGVEIFYLRLIEMNKVG